MLLSILSQPAHSADASRQAATLAAWEATTAGSPASYFYGYWFSHWRA
ncbi:MULTISPECIES: hypothetical protein [unclassified Pseudomonas]